MHKENNYNTTKINKGFRTLYGINSRVYNRYVVTLNSPSQILSAPPPPLNFYTTAALDDVGLQVHFSDPLASEPNRPTLQGIRKMPI